MTATRRLFALPLVLVAACGGGEGSDTASGAPEVLPDDVVVGVPDGNDIWLAEIFDVVGGGFTIDEARDLTSRPGYDNQPFFGDDGTLYFVQQEGVRTDVWRWDRGTDTKHRVTMTPDQSEYSPTLMPQSQGISMIRVEADSTQRLWAVDLDGSRDRVLLEDVQPVGYHAWFDAEHVAVFVLGSPATLQIANVTTGEVETVAENIGRSLQAVPGRRAVSFAQQSGDGSSTIRIWDLDTGRASDVAPAVEGGDFHAWTPGGTLLQGAESAIWAWIDGAWTQVGDFSGLGQRVSRLSVAPNGRSIAVVAEPIGGEGAP